MRVVWICALLWLPHSGHATVLLLYEDRGRYASRKSAGVVVVRAATKEEETTTLQLFIRQEFRRRLVSLHLGQGGAIVSAFIRAAQSPVNQEDWYKLHFQSRRRVAVFPFPHHLHPHLRRTHPDAQVATFDTDKAQRTTSRYCKASETTTTPSAASASAAMTTPRNSPLQRCRIARLSNSESGASRVLNVMALRDLRRGVLLSMKLLLLIMLLVGVGRRNGLLVRLLMRIRVSVLVALGGASGAAGFGLT